MVLSAAVSTKGGKVLLARQFQDIPKLRVEGLLAAFSKLVGSAGFPSSSNSSPFFFLLLTLFLHLIREKSFLFRDRFSSVSLYSFGTILCSFDYQQSLEYFGGFGDFTIDL